MGAALSLCIKPEIESRSHRTTSPHEEFYFKSSEDDFSTNTASISEVQQNANPFERNIATLLDEEVALAYVSRGYASLPKSHTAKKIQAVDEGTPDNWIPRSRDLIRLTGAHPFNSEPPIVQLFDQGFITPNSLNYVRNHGQCSRNDWLSHKLVISGLVEQEMAFTMDEMLAMPSASLPVTMVCAGNRRKELNMVKQTRGFHWGPAAISTSIWTGVKLTHLLRLCRVKLEEAKYVCFYGSEKESLPVGTFGASVGIVTALNDFSGIMVAYKQNGELLHPDHGFPLRVIIPGWVGARMVKWLEKIVVSDEPSKSFYHDRDNKIFPAFVDHELAEAEGFWKKDEYLFNELNINSVIVSPVNMETVSINCKGMYPIRGYAYSGGGRKITRVEVSLDRGISWRLCELKFPEERFSMAPRYGLYYCWMFWECTIDIKELVQCAKNVGEVKCRAWDVSNNTQPAEHNWNLLGYGNNNHFTVKVELIQTVSPRTTTSMEGLCTHVQFLHPTVAGINSSGWMRPQRAELLEKAIHSSTPEETKKRGDQEVAEYSSEQIAENNTKDSVWLAIDGKVYDATSYLNDHPGGAASILAAAGKDASELFNSIHSDTAKQTLEKFLIGEEKGASYGRRNTSQRSIGRKKDGIIDGNERLKGEDGLIALNLNDWLSCKLISRKEISQNTRLFKFELPTPRHRLGLAVGKHVLARVVQEGKPLVRQYTPISAADEEGSFTLCVKIYFAETNGAFAAGGKMSLFMENMNVGDRLSITGPFGHVEYIGDGLFLIDGKEKKASQIGMICGGTGITPAFQVMSKIFATKDDMTRVHLIYANRNENDILLRDEVDDMVEKKKTFRAWYTLENTSMEWRYGEGRVTEQMIMEQIPKAADDTLIFLCGPPPMIEACLKFVTNVGHSEGSVTLF